MPCKCERCQSDPRRQFVSQLAEQVDNALKAVSTGFLECYDNEGTIEADVINGLLNGMIIFAARHLFLIWRESQEDLNGHEILTGFNSKIIEAFNLHKQKHEQQEKKMYN